MWTFHFVAFCFYVFILFRSILYISFLVCSVSSVGSGRVTSRHVTSRTRCCVATCGTVALVGTDGPFVLVGTAPVHRRADHALIRNGFGSAQSPSLAPLLGAFDVAVVHLVATVAVGSRDWRLEQAGTPRGIALVRANLVRPGRGATTPANPSVVL